MQSQRIEADRVLGLVFPPFVVRNVAQCLDGIIVARREASIDKLLRGTLRLGGAKVCSLQEWRAPRVWSRPDSCAHIPGCRPACSRNIATTGDQRAVLRIHMSDHVGRAVPAARAESLGRHRSCHRQSSSIGFTDGSVTQRISLTGSRPSWAAIRVNSTCGSIRAPALRHSCPSDR